MQNKNLSIGNWSIRASHMVFALLFLLIWGNLTQMIRAESAKFSLDLMLVQISTASYSCYNENYIMIENSLDSDQPLDGFVIDVMGTQFPLDGLTIAPHDSHTYFLPVTLNLFEQVQQQPMTDSRRSDPVTNMVSLMYMNPESDEMMLVAQATNWSSHSVGQMVCETFIDRVTVDAGNTIESITLRHEDFEGVNLLAADFIGRHFEAAVDDVLIAFDDKQMPLTSLDYTIVPGTDGEPTVRINMTPYNVSSSDPLQLMAIHPITGEQISLDTVDSAAIGMVVPLAVTFSQQDITASAISIFSLSLVSLLIMGTVAIVCKP